MKTTQNCRPALLSSLFAAALLLANVAGAQCDLYPIALSAQSLTNVTAGMEVTNIMNGIQPGNFGWLTWAGSPSEPTLVDSLKGAGNSFNYVNPFDDRDRQINAGDWIEGKTGVTNSKEVRDALDALKKVAIKVPVWDAAIGDGKNSLYRVVGFAQVQITSYELAGQTRISVLFLGYTSCGQASN